MLRLSHGGAYTNGIRNICSQIRQNGTLQRILYIPITHPNVANTVNLVMNMAYQPNQQLPHINGSLYAVAFQNANGTWHFNVGYIGVALPGVPFPGNLDGSYASLGYAGGLPIISDANLMNAIILLHTYAGGVVTPALRQGMAALIVATCEAVRFTQVRDGINEILGTAANYATPGLVRDWGGHTLSS